MFILSLVLDGSFIGIGIIYNNTTFASSYKIHLSLFLYTCLTVHRVVPHSIGKVVLDPDDKLFKEALDETGTVVRRGRDDCNYGQDLRARRDSARVG